MITHTHVFIVGVSDERQGGRDGERERDFDVRVASCMRLDWGLNMKPRYIPLIRN